MTFSYTATLVLGLTDDLAGTVQNSITNDIRLHDDLDAVKVRWTTESALGRLPYLQPDLSLRTGMATAKTPTRNAVCTDDDGDLWDDATGEPCDVVTL